MRKTFFWKASIAFLVAAPTIAFAAGGPTHKAAKKKASTHASTPIAMDPARATQIQTALIKQGYLSGEPTGKWDAESVAAMQKLQSDNGWQTKITPDSRALIKLGLGPTSDQPAAATESQQAAQ